jgi:predicted anti-sigma-YlaC factor YlaD
MHGNQSIPVSDWNDMECSRWREALSAMADGENTEIDERLVAAHVARCPECRSYKEMIDSSASTVRLSESAGMADLSKKVSKMNAAADRVAHWNVLRIVLAVVAVQVIAFALPALVLGEEGDSATHAARHLGAFGVAYGAALLVVVVRPARARSILPVALVLAAAQVIGAIVDLATGRIPLVGEARHLPQIISVFLIWFLAVPSTRRHRHLRRGTRAAVLFAAGSSSSREHQGR